MRSMKAMAALAPQMKALQEKYGDDKQRQPAETMALYEQHNVNPVAGCLPILPSRGAVVKRCPHPARRTRRARVSPRGGEDGRSGVPKRARGDARCLMLDA
jgi:membrane protein insertase Oxa1/YidC/SpoIIIJ